MTWRACKGFLGPPAEFLIQQVWGAPSKSAFLTSPQVMLLFHALHYEYHCFKCSLAT